MTGLIYVAIIAVWAVILVPAWLRRHDHLDPGRSVDRFSRSMQTLARRPSILGVPLPSSLPDLVTDGEPAPAEVMRVTRPAPRRRGQRALMSAARLRRLVWVGLLGILVSVGGLVITGVLQPIALAIPVLLILGFLVLVRRQVRVARSRRVAARPVPAARPVRPAVRLDTDRPAAPTWEARSTPLPTYVTAPRAPAASPHPTTPGAWTAAAMLERAQQEKTHAERMAKAKEAAIARARAEQAAAEARTRDEEFLSTQAARLDPRPEGDSGPTERRAVNE